jgi:large subunit ribosomal protein L3
MEKTIKGVLGSKLGMTQIWDENNRVIPVTVVKVGPCVVTQVRTPETDGYNAVQLGYGAIDPRKVNKPMTGHFAKAGVTPRRHLVELRTTDASEYTVGQELGPDLFEVGERVDVIGTTKGKGFAGVMKRHGFAGLRASHGVQRKHRSPGSIGGCATPGRVFKGLRMAGRMGSDRQTTQNLKVAGVDTEKGLLLGQGCRSWPQGWLGHDHHRRQGRCEGGLGMSSLEVLDPAGKKSGSVDLPAEVFDVQVNVPLIHQVVVAQLAAARQGTHDTKTRAEVSGGGRKPYKQKGTGRARQGSIRAPQFAGGGIVHGPTPRDYSQRTPKKMKAAALRGALSDRARDGRIHVITTFSCR